MIADALAGLHERYEHGYGAGEHIAGLVRRGITARGTQRILDAVHRVAADRLPESRQSTGLAGGRAGAASTDAPARSRGGSRADRRGARAARRGRRRAAHRAVARGGSGDASGGRRGARSHRRSPGDCRPHRSRSTIPSSPCLLPAPLRASAIETRSTGWSRCLGNGDPSIRQAAIAALNSIGHPDMAARIAPQLSDPDPLVRESALRIAGYFGYPDCIEQVLQCCRDESEAVRRAAIESLAFFEDARVVPVLVEALDRRQPAAVRAAAAASLARTDHDVAADALTHALHDPDAWVRYVALRSLGVERRSGCRAGRARNVARGSCAARTSRGDRCDWTAGPG